VICPSILCPTPCSSPPDAACLNVSPNGCRSQPAVNSMTVGGSCPCGGAMNVDWSNPSILNITP
jgi:hypothetical protein